MFFQVLAALLTIAHTDLNCAGQQRNQLQRMPGTIQSRADHVAALYVSMASCTTSYKDLPYPN